MKLECEIIAAENDGTNLKLRLQGSRPGSPEWRPMGSHTLEIDDTQRNCRAFHLGRRITITIEPK